MKKSIGMILLFAFVLTACGNGGNASQPAASDTAPATDFVNGTDAPATAANTTDAVPPPSAAPVDVPVNPPGCTNSASFVADVTVPDYAKFAAGEAIHKVWRVRNTGTCAWSGQYTLIFRQGERMDAPDSQPMPVTPAGETADIAVDMTAPAADGNYRADFEIITPEGQAIVIEQSTLLWLIITVEDKNTAGTDGSDGGTTGTGGSGGGTTGTGGPGLPNVTCAYATNPANVGAVIAALQAYRAVNGLPPYNVDGGLTQAAQAHSADMACNSLFYHNGSNGSTAWSRVAAAGYSAANVTENVYGSYPPLGGQDVVMWWANDMSDIRHNQNLLSATYSIIGVGYSFFNNYGYYVIDFAVPAGITQNME